MIPSRRTETPTEHSPSPTSLYAAVLAPMAGISQSCRFSPSWMMLVIVVDVSALQIEYCWWCSTNSRLVLSYQTRGLLVPEPTSVKSPTLASGGEVPLNFAASGPALSPGKCPLTTAHYPRPSTVCWLFPVHPIESSRTCLLVRFGALGANCPC